MMKRFRDLRQAEGRWAFFAIVALSLNRIRLQALRYALQVPDVYIQGAPKIIGRRGIAFGRGFCAGRNLWLEVVQLPGDPPQLLKLRIGDRVSVSESVHIGAAHSVDIGDDVLVGSQVLITDHDHGRYGGESASDPDCPPNHRPLFCRGPVVIESNVWIGDGVRILSGARIGRGAVIAANAVVTGTVPPGAVYASDLRVRLLKQYDPISRTWSRQREA